MRFLLDKVEIATYWKKENKKIAAKSSQPPPPTPYPLL
jgi:hypothetical protein